MKQFLSSLAKKQINILFKNMSNILDNLYTRWQDEREYEDWAEYERCLKNNLSQVAESNDIAIEIKKVTKRPFGIHFNLDNCCVTLYVNATTIGWKCIKRQS